MRLTLRRIAFVFCVLIRDADSSTIPTATVTVTATVNTLNFVTFKSDGPVTSPADGLVGSNASASAAILSGQLIPGTTLNVSTNANAIADYGTLRAEVDITRFTSDLRNDEAHLLSGGADDTFNLAFSDTIHVQGLPNTSTPLAFYMLVDAHSIISGMGSPAQTGLGESYFNPFCTPIRTATSTTATLQCTSGPVMAGTTFTISGTLGGYITESGLPRSLDPNSPDVAADFVE